MADGQPEATPDDIAYLLQETTTWAVVGCSPEPWRDSHRIAELLQRNGFRIIPVNPAVESVLGETCYPSLADIPSSAGVEVVDVFRRSEFAGAVADEAVACGAVGVWMQLGVVDTAAAERARAAGLRVVMNRCPAVELPRLAAR
ncbi:MAG: CoA-binding protein [Actinomycetota bacterium]|nr:MAG: CoA-binding protein [Actinomycetota bacterium]